MITSKESSRKHRGDLNAAVLEGGKASKVDTSLTQRKRGTKPVGTEKDEKIHKKLGYYRVVLSV